MKQNFFAIDDPEDLRDKEMAMIADDSRPTPWVRCPVDAKHDRGGWYDPFVLKLRSAPKDFVCGWGTGQQCSAKVKDRIEAAGLTGVRFREVPVKVAYKGHRETFPYYGLEPMGFAGLPPLEAGLRQLEHCPACKFRYLQIDNLKQLVNPSTWDGSDFFWVWPLSNVLLMSERAANFFRAQNFTGVRVIRENEINFSWNRFGAMPLADRYDAETAKKLAAAIGIDE
jgi:hypothetical protein